MADLAFLWHMHQPDYRHPESGHFVLPWVLLHTIKDYSDMASHLERHPGIRCTVNFVPVLLDQIEDYADQLATGQWRDPLLRIAAHPEPDALDDADRAWLLDMAFRCHAPTMLEPFAPYRRLRDLLAFVKVQDANALSYLSGHYYADLATWFLLAWSGESLRRTGHAVPELMAKGDAFTLADRQRLLAELGGGVQQIIPRYRALSERGQVELSCTPEHHPLAPLLIDFKAAREAWPESPLPSAPAYPGGLTRVEAHLSAARASHERRFGSPPRGLWPAEGALSAPFLKQIGEAGFAWTASSHGVRHLPISERTASWPACGSSRGTGRVRPSSFASNVSTFAMKAGPVAALVRVQNAMPNSGSSTRLDVWPMVLPVCSTTGVPQCPAKAPPQQRRRRITQVRLWLAHLDSRFCRENALTRESETVSQVCGGKFEQRVSGACDEPGGAERARQLPRRHWCCRLAVSPWCMANRSLEQASIGAASEHVSDAEPRHNAGGNEVIPERPTALCGNSAGNRKTEIAVADWAARIGDRLRLRHLLHVETERVIILAGDAKEVALDARGVREQMAHCDLCGRALAIGAGFGQHLGDGRVEGNGSLFNQLHE